MNKIKIIYTQVLWSISDLESKYNVSLRHTLILTTNTRRVWPVGRGCLSPRVPDPTSIFRGPCCFVFCLMYFFNGWQFVLHISVFLIISICNSGVLIAFFAYLFSFIYQHLLIESFYCYFFFAYLCIFNYHYLKFDRLYRSIQLWLWTYFKQTHCIVYRCINK